MIDVREKLADLEHQQWVHWTDYMLDNLTEENISRWRRQCRTQYEDLTEKEKDSDRVWADRVLKTITIHNYKQAFGTQSEPQTNTQQNVVKNQGDGSESRDEVDGDRVSQETDFQTPNVPHELESSSAEVNAPVYKCGHRQRVIVLDDNILSMSAYEDWVSTYGYRGDESKCWDCYCKDSVPQKHNQNGCGRSLGNTGLKCCEGDLCLKCSLNHEEANK